MKKSLLGISIGSIILIASTQIALADYTGKSTVTTDPTKATYYNNDLKNNGAITNSATKTYATDPKNHDAVQKIIGANGGQCGIQCAKALDAAAQGGSNVTTPPTIATNTDSTKGDQVEVTGEKKETTTSTNTNKANSSTATDNILGLEEGKLKAGDVDMSTITFVIVNLISTLLAIAGTVAIFSLIYHAVKMQINSGITGDSSGVDSAKKGMIGALIGFVIAISAWFLVTQAVSLLGSIT